MRYSYREREREVAGHTERCQNKGEKEKCVRQRQRESERKREKMRYTDRQTD